MAAERKGGAFGKLGLTPNVLRGVLSLGYNVPTPVQRKTIPVALSGMDAVVMARTGSGKTAAFLIPLLEKLKEHSAKVGCRAVVLSPTRELALQTLSFARKMAKHTGLRFTLLVGGDSMEKQFSNLADNPDVIIATPGRLMHHLHEVQEFNLKAVEMIVFDEADRLFEMGFAEQLREVLHGIPEERQTLLFSATMPSLLVQFARAGLRDPVLIRLDTEHKVSEQLSMAFLTCRSADKPAALLLLLRRVIPANQSTVVFTATRHHAEFLHELLKEVKIRSSVIYGAMDQEARKTNLDDFRRGNTRLLLVTDVAARGIDIPLLDNVINYSFPPMAKLFVHRVGRVARQGRRGAALSIVDPDELPYMLDFFLYLGRLVTNIFSSGEGAGGVTAPAVTSGVTPALADATNANAKSAKSSVSGSGNASQQQNDQEKAAKEKKAKLAAAAAEAAAAAAAERAGAAMAAAAGSAQGEEQSRRDYRLSEMTPDRVHYGCFPQQALDEENEAVAEVIKRSGGSLEGLLRVCGNAIKQYKRTRRDPSRRAVERSKALDRSETHPLFMGPEWTTGGSNNNSNVNNNSVDFALEGARRHEFLKAMTHFRPRETILEVVGGGGTDVKADVGRIMGDVRRKLHLRKLLERATADEIMLGETTAETAEKTAQKRKRSAAAAAALVEEAANGKGNGSAEEVDSEEIGEKDGAKREKGAAAAANGKKKRSEGKSVGNQAAAAAAAAGKAAGKAAAPVSDGKKRKRAASIDREAASEPEENDFSSAAPSASLGNGANGALSGTKRKMSRAERKQLKKARKNSSAAGPAATREAASQGRSNAGKTANSEAFDALLEEMGEESYEMQPKKRGGGDRAAALSVGSNNVNNVKGNGAAVGSSAGGVVPGSFADPEYYIGYGVTESEAYADAEHEPMAAVSGVDALNASNLEAAIMDVNPDEAMDMRQKQRVLHWDVRKHKYVKTSVAELAKQKGARKIRTESGVTLLAKDAPRGELYEAWKKRSHRAVGRMGEDEPERKQQRYGNNGGASGSNANSAGGRGRLGSRKLPVPNADARDELRTPSQLKKEQKKKAAVAVKSLPKEQRKRVQAKQKEAYMAKRAAKERASFKGHTRSRIIVRT